MTCEQTKRVTKAAKRTRLAFGSTNSLDQAAHVRDAKRQARALAALMGAAA